MVRFVLASGVLTLSGAITPALAKESGDDASGPAIVVTGKARSYAPDTAAATKTDTPLRDTPQSVTVLTRDRLDDQGLLQLGDALRYVPGVTLGQGEGHRDQIVLRGQSSTADFYIDGLRDDAQYYRPLYATERVEVLKGANALLFGRGGGGGVVNRVSRSADPARTFAGIDSAVDSFGAWSLSGDANVALSPAAAIRLDAIYQQLDNHRDFFGGHFIGITPTATIDLGPATRLTASYEYAEDRRVTDRGVPSLSGTPVRGYRRTFFGDPATNRSEVTAHIARVRIEHAVTDTLTARLTAQYAHYDKFYANVVPIGATATNVTLNGYASGGLRENRIVQGDLVWKGRTGPIGHTLLAGFEAGDQDGTSTRQDALFAKASGGTALSTSVALGRTIVLPAVGFTPINRSSAAQVRTLSGFVQDQLEFGAHVQVLLGVRYDDFRIAATNRIAGTTARRSDRKWSPRAALILKPRPDMSIYASYARSFLPQTGDQFTTLDATQAALAPEAFRNLEIGAKWDIRPALAATLAAFQVDRSNTRATDPLTGNSVLSGASRVKGVEAALTGRIAAGWQASLGYTYQDGEIRQTTNAAPVGRALDKLPHHQFSLWTRYTLTPKLGIGAGVLHQSGQFATISNAVRVPGFTRFDGAVFWTPRTDLTLQLNVENLADTAYFASAHTDNNIATGAPRNVRLTARVKF